MCAFTFLITYLNQLHMFVTHRIVNIVHVRVLYNLSVFEVYTPYTH